ncbi:MAG TPA: hypothetical protein VGN93_22680 [Shinella sp.]|jgi:hypothetical protein|uniref:hypothetical protein n=1 Tax=Shinella sp. TaxID=1870904 RepID=UPI002E14E4BE|nr:hypothetical protein [Shinella sp.]
MANTVVIGVEGDPALYMIDLDAKTVEPIEALGQDALLTANAMRSAGEPVINGINFAVKVAQAPALSAGHFDGH